MENSVKSDDIVLLFENYLSESKKLHTSFKLAGKNCPVVVIDSDGFLPEDVTSVYEYFLGQFKVSENIPGKPRYFNQITVPEYWEISGNNSSGKVHNLNKERARIFYAEPAHKRLVRVVEWYDERGIVRSSDHYNRYGALYARTIFNAKGQRVNKSYFDGLGKEVIVENYVTKDIVLNDGDMVRIFHSKTEFVCFFMKKLGYENKRIFFNTLSIPFFVSETLGGDVKGDVLFWHEPVGDEIPGNMRMILDGKAKRTTGIKVQKRKSYEKLVELGASKDVMQQLGYIYPFEKENRNSKNVLICTNSDNIAQCEKLVSQLPELQFSIVALTEMSSKLMDMEKYKNVHLYPGAKMSTIEELFKKCDYYFDINHQNEILSAVQKAFLNNHLIFAFKETIHNAEYVALEHIYEEKNVEQMIKDIKEIVSQDEAVNKHIEMQHSFALLENERNYSI